MSEHTTRGSILQDFYTSLLDHFGHRNWWPADTPFEVCVGAILTQNTSWKNVRKAIENLKATGLLSAETIHRVPEHQLAGIIRPAGYFNVKARRLKNFVGYVMESFQGDLGALFDADEATLRERLLSVNGIGPETADSIMLYAAGKPVFVVDAYTKRVLERHGIIPSKSTYDEIQRLFHNNLKRDVALFNDFHAQFVSVGKNYCKTKPRCAECPLEPFLTERNPVLPVK